MEVKAERLTELMKEASLWPECVRVSFAAALAETVMVGAGVDLCEGGLKRGRIDSEKQVYVLAMRGDVADRMKEFFRSSVGRAVLKVKQVGESRVEVEGGILREAGTTVVN